MASRQKMQSMVMHVKQKRKYRQGIHDKHIGNMETGIPGKQKGNKYIDNL